MVETSQITSEGEEEKSNMSRGKKPEECWCKREAAILGCSEVDAAWEEGSEEEEEDLRTSCGTKLRSSGAGQSAWEQSQGHGMGREPRKEAGRQSRGLQGAATRRSHLSAARHVMVSCPRETHPQSSLQPRAASAPARP